MAAGEQNRPFFPGLIPIEAFLWRLWLREHEQEFGAFAYNVHVGQGVDPGVRPLTGDPALDARLRQQWIEATQKRIDVVGYALAETWVFEVEERPGTRALGQLLSYEVLLPASRPTTGQVVLAVVCRSLGRDMADIFEAQGIRTFRVAIGSR